MVVVTYTECDAENTVGEYTRGAAAAALQPSKCWGTRWPRASHTIYIRLRVKSNNLHRSPLRDPGLLFSALPARNKGPLPSAGTPLRPQRNRPKYSLAGTLGSLRLAST